MKNFIFHKRTAVTVKGLGITLIHATRYTLHPDLTGGQSA